MSERLALSRALTAGVRALFPHEDHEVSCSPDENALDVRSPGPYRSLTTRIYISFANDLGDEVMVGAVGASGPTTLAAYRMAATHADAVVRVAGAVQTVLDAEEGAF